MVSTRTGRRLGYWLVVLFLAAMIELIFFCDPGINHYHRTDFGRYMEGTGWKPFICRTLFPSTVRAISWATPTTFRSYVNTNPLTKRLMANPRVQKHLAWNTDYVYEYVVTYVLQVPILVGFVAIIRVLVARTLSTPAYVADVAGLLALLGLPTFFRKVNYIYDFPSLFLYTLCLLLMLDRKWLTYCMMFVLSAISRETTVLLIAIYTLTFRRDAQSRKLFDGMLAFQVLAYVVVKGMLAYVYRANPGSFVEFHVDHNLVLPPYSPADFLGWCAVFFTVAYHWQAKPILIRNTILMIFPLLMLMFFIGLLDEFRVYYEVYPGVIVAMGYTICKAMGIPCRPIAPTTRCSVRPAEPSAAPVDLAAVA